MHKTCLDWCGGVIAKYGLKNKSVLEVGSLDINGSVRQFFTGKYTGVDIEGGPGVDKVMNAHALRFKDRFDVVVSTEMLEHDAEFWLSVKEMGRMLKKGGYLILTARGNGFPEHNYPNDYWRFLPQSFELLFAMAGCEVLEVEQDTIPGMFGIGRKV